MVHYRVVVILVGAVVVCAIILLGIFDFLFVIPQETGTPISNPLARSEKMNLHMTLKSPTLSANIPIAVSATLRAHPEDHLSGSYKLLFADSSCDTNGAVDLVSYCQLVLNRTSSAIPEYHGEINNLIYSRGGNFNVIMNAVNPPPFSNQESSTGDNAFIEISSNAGFIGHRDSRIQSVYAILSLSAAYCGIKFIWKKG